MDQLQRKSAGTEGAVLLVRLSTTSKRTPQAVTQPRYLKVISAKDQSYSLLNTYSGLIMTDDSLRPVRLSIRTAVLRSD